MYQAPPPPYGAPPWQQVPPQYGPPPQGPQPQLGQGGAGWLVWTLALVGLAATLIGLSIPDGGGNAWQGVGVWAAVPVIGGLLTLVPAARFGLSPRRAWQVGVGGAALPVLFWVLFVLPAIGSGATLLDTIGAAAGVAAVWVARGRLGVQGPREHTW